jgi:hypothetical protein
VNDTDVRDDRDQGPGDPGGRINARQAAERALTYMHDMTGQEPEIVIAVRPDDDRWMVRVELLELSRVPDTTDILGAYEVELTPSGEPRGYRRIRRYHRGQGAVA